MDPRKAYPHKNISVSTCFNNLNLTGLMDRYQIEKIVVSSTSSASPFGSIWTIRAPFAFSIGASIPTRWQLARETLWAVSGCDSEHMITVGTSDPISIMPAQPPGKALGFGAGLSTGFRNVFITDTIFA